MKIVTWNCNGALRNKTEALDSLNADVYVVQECENPALSTQKFQDWAGDYLWTGKSKHKGLGVFPKNGHTVCASHWNGTFSQPGVSNSNPSSSWTTNDLKLFLPFILNNKFQVLGVWTKADNAEAFSYIGQLWKYLQIHRSQLNNKNTILLGDFNSNRIWDKPDCWWNHSDVVEELGAIGLQSVYHQQTIEQQGQETTPTFFLQRNVEKSYHIDYVFVSEELLQFSYLQVGKQTMWLSLSDHMPMTLKIEADS
jgi:exodeoxyribonuclease-3